MERAVIAIGVRKTGQLPELQAAVQSATNIAEWARQSQKVPAARVKLITDAKGAVSRDRIFDAVDGIVNLGFIEQLVIYFSGHGINSGMFEQWLLSRAPHDGAAAVNVKSSEFAARFSGIGHVVFISDACRTAADSIQAQGVTGAGIFPNVQPSGPESPVDQFYATLVGNPAFEVKSVNDAAGNYRAAYSTVLMEALEGKVGALIEPSRTSGLIRPWPLKRHLSTAVPKFFATLGLTGGVSSQPDAHIASDPDDPDAWISEVPLIQGVTAGNGGGGLKRRARRRAAPDDAPLLADDVLPPVGIEGSAGLVSTLESTALLDLRSVLNLQASGDRKRGVPSSRAAKGRQAPSASRLRYDTLLASGRETFGPDHMESECGIKIRGARIKSTFAGSVTASVGSRHDIIRVDLPNTRRGANVLVELTDGSVVLAPAFRYFLTGLSFDGDGNLDDIWCEPSANTPAWSDYAAIAPEIRKLRALVAASSALGVFRLDSPEEAVTLLDRIRGVKSVDPALAVYAAYAFNDRRMRSHIVDMQRHLDTTLGVRIFDIAMLAFELGGKMKDRAAMEMYPCVPMLTQGWALLTPLGVKLPRGLDKLRGELRPSLWTHFRPDGAGLLRSALKDEKV
jgi:hypothetical protein